MAKLDVLESSIKIFCQLLGLLVTSTYYLLVNNLKIRLVDRRNFRSVLVAVNVANFVVPVA